MNDGYMKMMWLIFSRCYFVLEQPYEAKLTGYNRFVPILSDAQCVMLGTIFISMVHFDIANYCV